jgi:signal transduction histidine kinase/DNA-binding response OmpR family regulator
MRNFNQSDGLQGNEFNQNAFYRQPSTGKLYFGGTNGVNAFYPEQIRVNPNKPRPVLTGLRVMNQPVFPGKKINDRVVLKQSLLFAKSIRLHWDERSFTIAYSSLNYDNPKGCRFRYRLREMDRAWNDVDATVREVTYAHLPTGSYRFEVYASNSDGLWSEQPAALDIRVLPPWWLSAWAWTIYVLILVSLAWFVYRFLSARLEYRRNLMHERLLNEKNKELTEAKLQFFTEISHEFRTPLTLIIDPLERLSAGSVPSEKLPQFYQLMNRNARQLLDLINQLLDFRKVQSKTLELNAIHADMVDFVRQVVSAFEQRAQTQQVRLNVLASESSLWMDFDADKMRKIINNLVSNAFKYSPVYGQITVRLNPSGSDHIRLEVQDNGPGIDPTYQDKIFEAFFQAGDAKKNAYGTGIGLALTKELVLLHGGSISVVSEKGSGCCFVIELPRKQSGVQEPVTTTIPAASTVFSEPLPEKTTAEGRPLLLFVDDHADIREYIRLNFGEIYEVVTAMDGLEGFNKAAEIVPDVVVSDIMMDGMDGFELCKRLKSDERTSHIPVLLLTARQTDESRVEGYDLGADAYLTKPFNTEVLASRINNLLEQRQKLQKLFAQGSAMEIRKIPVNITDEAFLNKTVGLIEQHMEDPDFDPDRLAELLRMSRSQLYRKIKGMTNRSVQEFMTSIRMNKALEFLLSGSYSISETAYKVGFSLPTNFTRTFTKHFGLSPSKYLEKHRK